ncbi:MAG TPA: methionyl-tRNA formyltransferase [Sphingobacterium sp.]|nr:methionyl-tRNA formyltransferase [Sphingobacterium sp.]
MRIVFMGTPDFAVASLEALIKSKYQVVGVVTAPDRPAGRGQKIKESAVKQCAQMFDIPVLQPERLRSPEFLKQLKELEADLQVVVAFRMLPEVVWNMPKKGTINVHASLLPQYRGAAPINHAILNGEKETGVTTFLLNHQIDTGNILLSKKIEISKTDDAGTLHDKLMHPGAHLLIETVDLLSANNITPTPQESLIENENLKPAPKIFRNDCKIDWTKDSETIYNHIRGLSPYPGAFTELDNKTLKIFKSKKGDETLKHQPGQLVTDGKSFIKIAAQDNYLYLLELQLQGKKKMNTEDFLRGNTIENCLTSY